MSCGIPCVVTDVGDSAQIVGDTGQVVAPRDPEAMARAWERLLKMGRDGRRDLGDLARSRIVENYEIEKIVNRFEDFYKMIAEKKFRTQMNADFQDFKHKELTEKSI